MASDIGATICTNMRNLRVKRHLSLQEVANRSGLSKSHIWELEQGRATNPTIGAAVAIAGALGVSLDILCGLSSAAIPLHPEALRIACEIDSLLKRGPSHD